MSDANNKVETQPNTDTETLIRQMERSLIDKIDQKIDNKFAELEEKLKAEIKSESDIKNMIKHELNAYSTTEQTQTFVAGLVAPLNRNFSEFKTDSLKTFEEVKTTLNKFTSRAETWFDQIRLDVDKNTREITNNQNATATYVANQEIMLKSLGEMNETLRGKGKDNGLVGDISAIRKQTDDQEIMIEKLTAVSTNNASLHEELLKREKARQDRNDKLLKWGWEIFKFTSPAWGGLPLGVIGAWLIKLAGQG